MTSHQWLQKNRLRCDVLTLCDFPELELEALDPGVAQVYCYLVGQGFTHIRLLRIPAGHPGEPHFDYARSGGLRMLWYLLMTDHVPLELFGLRVSTGNDSGPFEDRVERVRSGDVLLLSALSRGVGSNAVHCRLKSGAWTLCLGADPPQQCGHELTAEQRVQAAREVHVKVLELLVSGFNQESHGWGPGLQCTADATPSAAQVCGHLAH